MESKYLAIGVVILIALGLACYFMFVPQECKITSCPAGQFLDEDACKCRSMFDANEKVDEPVPTLPGGFE